MTQSRITNNVASLALAALFALSASAQGLQTQLIQGKVLSGGKGVGNVAVTDGTNIVRTGDDGSYSILTPADTRFVYITIPSGYEVENKNATIPQFYKELGAADNYDFELKKSAVDDKKHVFFVHADAQVTSPDELKLYSKVVADNADLAKKYGNIKKFAFDCGDIVGDSPWLFPGYIETIEPLGLPVYRAKGNHDSDYHGRTFETSYKTFEKYFGPTHFSYDCGDAHYIIVNNIFYTGYGINYFGYVPENTFKWLEQDLAGVGKDKLVFVFMHIPSALVSDISKTKFDPDLMTNVRQFHELFKNHDTHIISGHTHFNANMEYGDRLMEHNTAAACGTWWKTEECMDGAPRGYGVYEVGGNKVKWYYKSSGYDPDYQMRVYAPGAAGEHPEDVIANVWNYDTKWKVELLENGKKTADMKQYTGYDPISKAHCSDRSVVVYEWIWPITNDHMFHATPKIPGSKRQVRVTDRFGKVYISDVK